MRDFDTWQSVALQLFKYSEKNPIYYINIVMVKVQDGVFQVRRHKLNVTYTDLKQAGTGCKAACRRLKLPYVVRVENNLTELRLTEVIGGKEHDVILRAICKRGKSR